MTISRATASIGSADAIGLHSGGPIRKAGAVALVDAFGVVQGGSTKLLWLGTGGAVTSPGATVSTASSTTAVYYQVPAGKVAQIWTIIGVIYDTGGTPTWATLGGRTAPSNGLRIRTVDTDTTTAIDTIVENAVNNLFLAQSFGHHGTTFDKTSGDSALRMSMALPSPITLTAGQRFEVTPLSSVAYSRGVWSLLLTESDAT